jgi:hypothetical protein
MGVPGPEEGPLETRRTLRAANDAEHEQPAGLDEDEGDEQDAGSRSRGVGQQCLHGVLRSNVILSLASLERD